MAREKGEQSLSNIAYYLKNVDFPAHRNDIVLSAEENDAPDEILDILEDLPDMEYSSLTDLMHEIESSE